MPVLTTDIKRFLSGGAANAVPVASLGGIKSSVEVVAGTLFDTVTGDESAAGDTEYRCIYVHNAHSTLALTNVVAWLTANTPSATTAVSLGLGSSVLNATEQTVANEGAAPAGVTFLAAATKGAGVALGDIPAGQSRALWIRRVVDAGTAAVADSFNMRVEGDTAA